MTLLEAYLTPEERELLAAAPAPAALFAERLSEARSRSACVWCGEVTMPGTGDLDADFIRIVGHVKTCPKNPLVPAVQHLRGLVAALDATLENRKVDEPVDWDAYVDALDASRTYLAMYDEPGAIPIPRDMSGLLARALEHLRDIRDGEPVEGKTIEDLIAEATGKPLENSSGPGTGTVPGS